MADTLPTYDDAHLVRQIEGYLQARPSDHMLGCQVRNLFVLRAASRRVAPKAKRQRGWIDTGSGPGAVIPLPDDDPRQ